MESSLIIQTGLPIVTLLGAMVTFGIMWSKVNSLEKKSDVLEKKIDGMSAFAAEIAVLKEQVSQMTDVVKEIGKDIKEYMRSHP